MTTRFAEHLLTGDHASRPAASDVPQGTLYSCTTHSILYQSDGVATWSTWATTSPASVDYAEDGDISTQAFGDAPAAGASASEVAGANHKHGMPALGTTPSTQAFGDAAAGGAATTPSKNDHKHAMPANPVTAHEAAGDPHSGYRLESADHTHASSGAQGGQLGTAALSGLDTDPTLAANSDAKLASQKATKSYVDAAVTGLLDFKGSTNCSANPNYPAASKGDAYVVSVAGKIGGGAGKSVDAGDVYLATVDNAGGTEASVGASWTVLEHNLAGALLSANNLSELASAATARDNLGLELGVDVPSQATFADHNARHEPGGADAMAADAAAATASLRTLGPGAAQAAAGDHAHASSVVTVTKGADESVSSSTALQDDNELFFQTVAGKVYLFQALIIYASPAGGGTPDFKPSFSEDATARGVTQSIQLSTADATTSGLQTTASGTFFSIGTAAGKRTAYFIGHHIGNGGIFRFRWAQVTSDANAVIVYANSWLRYEEFAG